MRIPALVRFVPLALMLAACAGRPTKALSEAEGALADARLAEKCAPEEYAAAQRMLAKANELADKGEHGEAEAAARAAKKLALQARNKAMLRREECEKENQPQPVAVNPDDFIEQAPAEAAEGPVVEGELQTIYFDFDSFDLTPEARETLAHNARWMKAHPDRKVVIQGHCDKRGSTEYNLALGEKRAQVVRNYLRSLGLDAGRLSIISYGEEQLADFGDSEAAHARNRRAEFRAY